MLDQVLAALVLLDLAGPLEQRIEIAEFVEQLRRRLGSDAGNAGNIVGRIAGQRLQFDHLFRRHAPFLDHFVDADGLVLHLVIHDDVRTNELHQILVGGDDCHVRAGFARLFRISGDQIVRLETVHFDTGHVEGAGCLADQAELRAQIFRRFGPVGLVFGVELIAEGFGGIVENHRKMGRHDADFRIAGIAQQFPQHVAETVNCIDRKTIGFARKRLQRMIGPEDIGGAVHQEEMIAGFHCMFHAVRISYCRRRHDCPAACQMQDGRMACRQA